MTNVTRGRHDVGPGPVTTGHRTGYGRASGTFGELLQGVLPDDGRDFLVTLPISEFSAARFTPTGAGEPLTVIPAAKEKTRRLLLTMTAACGYRGGGVLELTSGLAEGKGLASSSADLVAAARAVADALGLPLEATAIEALLRQIEPSDGVMYDGIVSYYHRESRLRERLGCLPRLTIVAVDEGGQVDTVRYNRSLRPRTDREKQEYAELLATLTTAVRAHDLATVGMVATRSAVLSTKVRPRPYLSPLVRIGREADALGLALAHSGTVLGVLIAEHDPEHDAKLRQLTTACRLLGGAVSVYTSSCLRDECRPEESDAC
ncbi:GHMP family kinase ATP-binding protein [Streptomyces litchfieldiae]|uniref:Kinase n=1 Tax=Streptomyces litchfieldiae TaxID=3075543 RepID=A0ABU2MQN0_9ACTN|nr:kinase [Streptomyces sp. DSM 44938]MDT0343924.1 kinase [Streptomyces sp. DSM 44938]